jgi:signal transduction histidine kinase
LKVASENQEYLLKTQTEEMRHMLGEWRSQLYDHDYAMLLCSNLITLSPCSLHPFIGNVAHDLRTPLQAFQSELDVLRDSVKDNTTDRPKQQFNSIKQLVRICHFMNMTINRSIDFTKASTGIKLNPSIESINFSETLSWAVGCMVKSSENVPIVVAAIPKSIHKRIYTDKHWLMENILCLLSNAQKFTTEGNITIRCSLHSAVEGPVVQQTSLPPADDYVDNDSNSEDRDAITDIETGNVQTHAVMTMPMLLIEVEDTGIGISQENQDRLFQPFMQVGCSTFYLT